MEWLWHFVNCANMFQVIDLVSSIVACCVALDFRHTEKNTRFLWRCRVSIHCTMIFGIMVLIFEMTKSNTSKLWTMLFEICLLSKFLEKDGYGWWYGICKFHWSATTKRSAIFAFEVSTSKDRVLFCSEPVAFTVELIMAAVTLHSYSLHHEFLTSAYSSRVGHGMLFQVPRRYSADKAKNE